MKLDQIPKKNPFEAPDGYFDRLPGIIQSRVAAEKPVNLPQVYFRFAFRYALPVLVFVAVGIFWFRSERTVPVQFETELASISAQDLELYLENTEMNTDELVGTITWSQDDLQELENAIYSSYELTDTELNELIDVYEVEKEKN